MSNITHKLFYDSMGGRPANEYIGNVGEVFYDPETGEIRLSDGQTIGGVQPTENSALESYFTGPWVYFVRPDNQPDVVDVIAPNLIIKRWPGQNNVYENGSIFNVGDNGEGDPWDSSGSVSTPYGTQWNNNGWQDLTNIKDRYYEDFVNALAGGGWASVKHEYVMHDTMNDKYYAIRFLTWDSGYNGETGSFSYIRREINANLFFKRDDTNDEETALTSGDEVDNGLIITRGNGGAFINYAEGLADVWTQFNVSADAVSITWNTDQTVTVVDPTPTMLEALNALQVGDTVNIDNGVGGPSSQTVTEVYNPATGTFKLDYGPDPFIVSSFLYMDLPTLQPLETEWDDNQSPLNTLWNAEGYDDLTNLKSRQFKLLADIFVPSNSNLGQHITGKELIMWDTVNDKYYAILVTRWQQGDGWAYPGFSYTRRLIDTEKLSSGLKFPDGTIQNTAYTVKNSGVVKQSPRDSSTASVRYLNGGDVGKTIYLYSGTATNTLRLADAGAVEFPVGSTITIVNRTGSTVYLYKENDNEYGTIYGAGTSDSSTGWQIPDNGGGNIATLMKIETGMDPYFNDWILSGSNIVTD